MLQTIIKHLSDAIYSHTERTIPLAVHRHTSDGKVYPCVYIGKGQYKEINIDNFDGLSYFRQVSKTTTSEAEGHRPLADLIRFVYSLRVVTTIKNESFGKDDSFASDTIALSIIKDLVKNPLQLKQQLKANSLLIVCESYDSNVKDILAEEYKGIERLKNSIPYEYSMVAIDFKCEVVVSASCIDLLCNAIENNV